MSLFIERIAKNSPHYLSRFLWQLTSIDLPSGLDAVIIASYPRSGNTWARYFISYLASMDPTISRGDLNRYVPDLHQVSLRRISRSQFIALKSHSYPSRSYTKFIYLVRDPRDIALSYYSFLHNRKAYMGSRHQFISEWARGRIYPGAWGDHVRSWQRYGNKTESLFVRFEDMVIDPRGQFEEIAHFLGIQNVGEAVNFALDQATFEKFKSDEIYDKMDVKGQKERWRSLLNDVEVKALQDVWKIEMKSCSYPLV